MKNLWNENIYVTGYHYLPEKKENFLSLLLPLPYYLFQKLSQWYNSAVLQSENKENVTVYSCTVDKKKTKNKKKKQQIQSSEQRNVSFHHQNENSFSFFFWQTLFNYCQQDQITTSLKQC